MRLCPGTTWTGRGAAGEQSVLEESRRRWARAWATSPLRGRATARRARRPRPTTRIRPSRALWPADASLGAPADPRRADAALADLSPRSPTTPPRVPSVAAHLRRHRPEGHAAADALVSAADAVAARDWRAAARAAVASQAAHSRQLDVGNWPHECWPAPARLRAGFQVAAELHAPTAHEVPSSLMRVPSPLMRVPPALAPRRRPSSARSRRIRGGGWRPASAERWSPADRLGRVALEALAMAALDGLDEIPRWRRRVLLAERACAAAVARRAPPAPTSRVESRRDVPTPNRVSHPGQLPPDAPAIDPSRAVPRASADDCSPSSARDSSRPVAPSCSRGA